MNAERIDLQTQKKKIPKSYCFCYLCVERRTHNSFSTIFVHFVLRDVIFVWCHFINETTLPINYVVNTKKKKKLSRSFVMDIDYESIILI